MKIKFFFYVVLMFLVTILCYSKDLEIKRVYSSKNLTQVIIEFDSLNTPPSYVVNYDPQNQLIFLNVKNGKLKSQLKDSSYNSKYIENFKSVSLGKGTGFFIKHKKNISYKVTKGKNSIILNLNSNLKKQFTIAIDAGHGGKDPGASHGGKKEKDIALSVTKYLKSELKKDFNVILIRNEDVFLNLSARPKIANQKKADMFISIHLNASNNIKAEGVEVFYFSKTSSPYAARVAAYENKFGETFGENVGGISQILGELEYKKYQEVSAKLAKGIVDSLANSTKMKNRGIHGANFAVLRGLGRPETVVPGILIELGFLTNVKDREKLASVQYQKIMAQKVSEQVKKYFY
ncbi:MAG: N-acetylmuramoyl-L-alanine amidase family protein [Fusobacteriaceae bacterium]